MTKVTIKSIPEKLKISIGQYFKSPGDKLYILTSVSGNAVHLSSLTDGTRWPPSPIQVGNLYNISALELDQICNGEKYKLVPEIEITIK